MHITLTFKSVVRVAIRLVNKVESLTCLVYLHPTLTSNYLYYSTANGIYTAVGSVLYNIQIGCVLTFLEGP